MSLGQSPGIVTNGLVFAYDMENTKKSWKGKPTINHAYGQNARADASYTSYVQTTSGTWPQHHPDAIRAYNYQGVDITGYVNTGVGDYTNTYHAIWTLDPILKRPVVTMRDVDGQWKAKSFGLSSGTTPNAMGVGYGDTYTISWLQWTDNIAKSANAGMYGQDTSGSNNFWDGLSNSYGTSYNTKPYTWQRVWATFTVSTSRNLAASWSCYMYGHYITRGTIKIADVQIESGSVSGFIENGGSTRLTNNNLESTPSSPTWNQSASSASGDTLTFTNGSYNSKGTWDLYKQYTDLTNSVNYTWSALVKLGTATNLLVTMNNSLDWNTGPSIIFDQSSGLSTDKWTRVKITGTTDSTKFNLHLGATYNINSSSTYRVAHRDTVQTAGTVYIKDVRLVKDDTQSALEDLAGQNTITVSSLTYNSDGSLSFLNNSGFYIPTIDMSSEQTIEIWLQPLENDSARRNPYNQAYGGYGTWTHEPSGNINYYYGNAGSNASPYTSLGSEVVNQNEIACMCVTRNTSTVTWYKNGVATSSAGNPYGVLAATSADISIGTGYAGTYYGNIFAVRLYNRALTADEVMQNFNALRGRYGI